MEEYVGSLMWMRREGFQRRSFLLWEMLVIAAIESYSEQLTALEAFEQRYGLGITR